MPGPSGAAPDGPEFSGLGDELAYVFPSDAGLSCVAISVNLDEYERLRHDVQRGSADCSQRHHGLWDRYAASRPQGRVLGSGPMPDYVRQAAGEGWALVGDAGMHQDPWTGLGMDSAAIAAEALVDTYVARADSTSWADAYEAPPRRAAPRRVPRDRRRCRRSVRIAGSATRPPTRRRRPCWVAVRDRGFPAQCAVAALSVVVLEPGARAAARSALLVKAWR